jgi:FlaA1/EpsC-like NDP-sugar epimerase
MINFYFHKILNMNKVLKSITLVIADIFFIIISTFLSLSIISSQVEPISKSLILYCILVSTFYVPISYIFTNYNSINRLFDLKNIINLLKASILTSVVLIIISNLSYFRFLFLENIIIQNIILLFLILNLRLILKFILNIEFKKITNKKKNCIIYGAGDSGSQIYENSSELIDYKVKCFLDDDLKKAGRYLKNLKIYHSSEIKGLLKKYKIEKIFIAILNLSTYQKEKIYKNLKNLKIDYEYLNRNDGSRYKKDLDKINFSKKNILDFTNDNLIKNMTGKTVLITGAAGTIGEELCFQLIKHVKFLVAIDNNELGISNLIAKLSQQEINKTKVYLTNLLELNDVKEIVGNHKPDYIFHAAAYKHVEICEENPFQASKNNCVGIYNILLAANEFKIPNFTFISTDKAVNPVNIMGKTKQFGEYLVKYFGQKKFIETQSYISVRFGNVLNSSGSLIPKIRKQIENNHNVSITHKQATRYFMTISDAVALVLESTFLNKNGKTFVLKMGDPINIYNLAVKMINDYKIVQNKNLDIKINIIGLRPGEKLHEELCHEGFKNNTANDHIFLDEKSFNLNIDLEKKINELNEICINKKLVELNKFYNFLLDDSSK